MASDRLPVVSRLAPRGTAVFRSRRRFFDAASSCAWESHLKREIDRIQALLPWRFAQRPPSSCTARHCRFQALCNSYRAPLGRGPCGAALAGSRGRTAGRCLFLPLPFVPITSTRSRHTAVAVHIPHARLPPARVLRILLAMSLARFGANPRRTFVHAAAFARFGAGSR
jgi:hypothetical protein